MASRRLRTAAFSLALAITLPMTLCADGLETKVLAAYLYNFTKFIDWPAPFEPHLRICVLDAPELAQLLTELAGRRNNRHHLQVVESLPTNLHHCQMLYLGRDTPRSRELLRTTRAAPVLTVSATPGFITQGGLVGFYRAAGKLKVEINPTAVETAGLRISAKLMEIARLAGNP
jgi:hypothetical protein